MRTVTRLLSAAAVALTLSAMAAPTQAAVFAQWAPVANKTNFLWLNNGPGNTGTGGSLFTTATATSSVLGATNITFTLFDNPDLFNIAAKLTLSGTSTATPAVFSSSTGTYAQTNINGSFSIIYTGATQLFGSTLVTHNSNLLSGAFTNAWIQGVGSSGGFDVSLANGGSANFTSAYDSFANVVPGSDEFAIHLGATGAGIGRLNATKALKTFRANAGGNFSNSVVPEPASWALMIMGFGGVGAMLRSRRREGLRLA